MENLFIATEDEIREREGSDKWRCDHYMLTSSVDRKPGAVFPSVVCKYKYAFLLQYTEPRAHYYQSAA